MKKASIRAVMAVSMIVILLLVALAYLPKISQLAGYATAEQEGKITIQMSKTAEIDLAKYFGEGKTYLATTSKNLTVETDGNMLMITPDKGFIGERTIKVFASGAEITEFKLRISVADTGTSLEDLMKEEMKLWSINKTEEPAQNITAQQKPAINDTKEGTRQFEKGEDIHIKKKKIGEKIEDEPEPMPSESAGSLPEPIIKEQPIVIAEPVEITEPVKDASGAVLRADIVLSQNDIVKYAGKSTNVLIAEKGIYDVMITPENSPIKSIGLQNVSLASGLDIGIDAPEDKQGFEQLYAIDPTAINFTNATVTVLAKANILYKCKGWNFSSRECPNICSFDEQKQREVCHSGWQELMNITPGKDYNFTLMPEDPGYAEYNATLGAPQCKTADSPCIANSSLLKCGDNQASPGPEPNQPNTIDACNDSTTSGTCHSDESVENITITDLNSSYFRPGDTVNVTVWWYCYDSTSDRIAVYYTNSTSTISWKNKLVGTTICPSTGYYSRNVTFTLDNVGSEHAVRAIMLYSSDITSACPTSASYLDVDDLAFILDYAPPNVTLDRPANNYYNDTAQYVNLTFNATVTDDAGLKNCSLWTNYSGVWSLNQTQNVSGRSNTTSFNLTDLTNSAFIWNIQCYDIAQSAFATSNRTVMLNWTSQPAVAYSAIREQKTVEYFVYQDLTQFASGSTKSGSFRVFVPESNPAVKSAYFEVHGFVANAQLAAGMTFKLFNGSSNTTLRSTITTGPANTGEYARYVFRVDASPVLKQILANGTYNYTLYTTVPRRFDASSARLVLTYEHDYSPRQVKTVRFFIGQRNETLPLNTNTSFTFNLGLPENNVVVRGGYFQTFGRIAPGNTTDNTVAMDLDGAGAVSGAAFDNALTSTYDFALLYNSSFNVSQSHTFNFRTTAGYPIYAAGTELVLTYEYDSSSPTQMKTVRYLVGQDTSLYSSVNASINFTLNVSLPESSKSVASAYNKVRFASAYDTGTAVLLNSSIRINSSVLGGAGNESVILIGHIDEMQSTSTVLYNASGLFNIADGNVVVCSVGNLHPNSSYYTGSMGCELVVTYKYSTASSSQVKTVEYLAGEDLLFAVYTSFTYPLSLLLEQDASVRQAYLDVAGMNGQTTAGTDTITTAVEKTPTQTCNYRNTGENLQTYCWDNVTGVVAGKENYRVLMSSNRNSWYDGSLIVTYSVPVLRVGWNNESVNISASPGTVRSVNAAVISVGNLTGVTVTKLSGTSFISAGPLSLGNMSQAEARQVQFNCSPSASQARGVYGAVFNVNSSEDSAGDNLAVGCRVTSPFVELTAPENTAYNTTALNIAVYVANDNVPPSAVWYSLNNGSNVSITSRIDTDWPMFRRDFNHTGASRSYPVKTNATFFKVFGAIGTYDDFMSPAIVNDTIYIGSKTDAGWVRAYNATTGNALWEFFPYQECWDGAFSYDAGRIYLGCRRPAYHNYFFALNASTGSMLWNWTKSGTETFRISGSPAVKDGVVYFCTRDTRLFYALNASTGVELWNLSGLPADCTNSVALVSEVDGSVLYAGINSATNSVMAVYTNGTSKWNTSISSIWDSSPVIAGDYLYIGVNGDNSFRALNRSSGAVVWSYDLISGNIYDTLTYYDGRIYGLIENNLYSFNLTNGSASYPSTYNWVLNLGGTDPYGTCAGAGGLLYCPSSIFAAGSTNLLRAVNVTSGTVLWNYGMKESSYSSFVVADGIAYIGSDDMNLYAIGDEKHYGYEALFTAANGANTLVVYANNSDGVVNSTTIQFNATAGNLPPSVVLNLPANNTQFNNTQNVNFSFTATDDNTTVLNCSIYLDGLFNQSNETTQNGTLTNFLVTNISFGSHNWSVNCSDGYLSGVSETRHFITSPNCGASITGSTNLTSNLTGNGTCLTIGADNVTLDCSGYSLIGNGTAGNGINLTNRNGISVKNCRIMQWETGIFGNISAGVLLLNNTFNNSRFDVQAYDLNNTQMVNNTFNGGYSAGTDSIVQIIAQNSNSRSINITGNNMSVSPATSASLDYGLQLAVASSYCFNDVIVAGNSLSAQATALSMASVNGTTVENNTFLSAVNTTFVSFSATEINGCDENSSVSFRNNTIYPLYPNANMGSRGVEIGQGVTASDNTVYDVWTGFVSSQNHRNIFIENNNISGIYAYSGYPGSGVYVFNNPNGNITIQNNTINQTGNYDVSVNSSSEVHIVDSIVKDYYLYDAGITLTKTGEGLLRFLNTSVTENGTNLVGNASSDIRITSNLVFVNSFAKPGLNTTANITLYNLPFVSVPRIYADRNDDGVFEEICQPPACYNLSYAGGTFIFNSTHFTFYTANSTMPPTQDPPILNSTYGTNTTSEDLTVYPQNVTDIDGDSVINQTTWYRNSTLMYNYTKEIIMPGLYSNLYMPFDDPAWNNATFARDYSPYENNGTVNGATYLSTGGPDGSGAYNFSGADNIDVGYTAGNFSTADNFTVDAWIDTNTFSNNVIVGRMTSGAQGWHLRTIAGSKVRFLLGDGSSFIYADTGVLSAGWNHLAATWDGSSSLAKVYVDGELSSSQVGGAIGEMNTNVKLYIGDDDLSSPFVGTIDKVRIYNFTAGATQARALYRDNSTTLVSGALAISDVWQACNTPNDGYGDGTTKCSSNVTIQGPYLYCLNATSDGILAVDSTITITSDLICKAITINNSATLFVNSTAAGNKSVLIQAENITIALGSKINTTGYGYTGGFNSTFPNGSGPSGGVGNAANNGGGGAYGGDGGQGSTAGNLGGKWYNSSFQPLEMGSGGGFGSTHRGGNGGGAIRIAASNLFILNGNIESAGMPPTSAFCAGGGAGGSIYITATNITGSGNITANGGNGGISNGFCGQGGGGGGGRIIVYYNTTNWTKTDINRMSVSGGASGGGSAQPGEVGTLAFIDVPNDFVNIFKGFRFQSNDMISGAITHSIFNMTDALVRFNESVTANASTGFNLINSNLTADNITASIKASALIFDENSTINATGRLDLIYSTLFSDTGAQYIALRAFTLENESISEIAWINETLELNNIQANLSTNTRLLNNSVFVNSTAVSALNTTANITLYGVSFTLIQAMWDPEDDGTFVACPANICTNIIYAGNVFKYNVTSFTTYSSNNGAAPPTHDTPILNSTFGTNLTTENLTVYPQNVTDLENDSVTNITNWEVNGASVTVLNLPFDTNLSSNASGALRDYTPYQNNGTLGNGYSAGVPAWISGGILGGAYDFDGVNDHINVSDADSLDLNYDLSIGFWIKLRDNLGNPIIGKAVLGGISDGYNYLFTASSNAVSFAIVPPDAGAGTWGLSTPATLPQNTWLYIVGTFDNSTRNMSIYVNGTLANSVTRSLGSPPTSALDVAIGRTPYGPAVVTQFFNGSLDEVKIYNRTLSAEQVGEDYNNGAPKYTTIVSQETAGGDIWRACLTPNDGVLDGQTKCSNNLTVLVYPYCPGDKITGVWVVNSNYVATTNITCRVINITNNAILYINSSGGGNVSIKIEAENITVDAGSEINADYLGYLGGTDANLTGQGPGGGAGASGANWGHGAGGAHGGDGGYATSPLVAGGVFYDSSFNPVLMGSGGGGAGGGSNYFGGAGGGSMEIVATDTLALAGQITADGETPPNGICIPASGWYFTPGGGGGGSVWITAGNITGAGNISADGGNAYTCPTLPDGGGGGGGRVIVYYNTTTWTANDFITKASAAKGLTQAGSTTAKDGDFGTVAFIDPANNIFITDGFTWTQEDYNKNSSWFVWNNFTVNNASNVRSNMTLQINISGIINITDSAWNGNASDLVFGVQAQQASIANSTLFNMNNVLLDAPQVTLVNSTIASAPNNATNQIRLNATSIILQNGSELRGNINVTSVNISIDGSSLLNATSYGFSGGTDTNLNGYGPGGGVGVTSGSDGLGAGGAYGGDGGSSIASLIAAGGVFYDSSFNPALMGSGGGGAGGLSNYFGGNGGGMVKITAAGILTLAGQIVAEGQTARNGVCNFSGNYFSPGGGGGGYVLINVYNLTGTGNISADGGDAYNCSGFADGGGGGGGRIAVYYNTTNWNVTDFLKSSAAKGLTGSSGNALNGTDGTLAFIDAVNDDVFIVHYFKFQANDEASGYLNRNLFNITNAILMYNASVLANATTAFNLMNSTIEDNGSVTAAITGAAVSFDSNSVINVSGTLDIAYNTFSDIGAAYLNGLGLVLERMNLAEVAWHNNSLSNIFNLSVNAQLDNQSAFVNSTSGVGLNQSANITFFGVTQASPVMIWDPEDDGTFVACPANVCTQINYSGTTFLFNVTRFTNYSLLGGGAGPTINTTQPDISVLNYRLDDQAFNSSFETLNGTGLNSSYDEENSCQLEQEVITGTGTFNMTLFLNGTAVNMQNLQLICTMYAYANATGGTNCSGSNDTDYLCSQWVGGGNTYVIDLANSSNFNTSILLGNITPATNCSTAVCYLNGSWAPGDDQSFNITKQFTVTDGVNNATNPNGTLTFTTDKYVGIHTLLSDVNVLNFQLGWQNYTGIFDTSAGTCSGCTFDLDNFTCQAEVEKIFGMFQTYNMTINLTPDSSLNFSALNLICRTANETVAAHSGCSALFTTYGVGTGGCAQWANSSIGTTIPGGVALDIHNLTTSGVQVSIGTISPRDDCKQVACELNGTWEAGNTQEFTINKTFTVSAV